MIGSKQVPILEKDDGTYMSESLEIVEYLDNLDGKPVLTGPRNTQIDAWINFYSRSINRLTIPRFVRLDFEEFKTEEGKVYLSPILDGFNSEIISYALSTSPHMNQINEMLRSAFKNRKDLSNLVLHSDQGWQYQHYYYQKTLKKRKIIQSMSRKATCLDNSLMENFFGRLKVEMYYGSEKLFKTVSELMKAIDDYIDFYNNDRIKLQLNGLSPVDYRKQSV